MDHEVVSRGAWVAARAALLAEEKAGPLLVDVTPLSLGIATFGGKCARMIERNTTVPTWSGSSAGRRSGP